MILICLLAGRQGSKKDLGVLRCLGCLPAAGRVQKNLAVTQPENHPDLLKSLIYYENLPVFAALIVP